MKGVFEKLKEIFKKLKERWEGYKRTPFIVQVAQDYIKWQVHYRDRYNNIPNQRKYHLFRLYYLLRYRLTRLHKLWVLVFIFSVFYDWERKLPLGTSLKLPSIFLAVPLLFFRSKNIYEFLVFLDRQIVNSGFSKKITKTMLKQIKKIEQNIDDIGSLFYGILNPYVSNPNIYVQDIGGVFSSKARLEYFRRLNLGGKIMIENGYITVYPKGKGFMKLLLEVLLNNSRHNQFVIIVVLLGMVLISVGDIFLVHEGSVISWVHYTFFVGRHPGWISFLAQLGFYIVYSMIYCYFISFLLYIFRYLFFLSALNLNLEHGYVREFLPYSRVYERYKKNASVPELVGIINLFETSLNNFLERVSDVTYYVAFIMKRLLAIIVVIVLFITTAFIINGTPFSTVRSFGELRKILPTWAGIIGGSVLFIILGGILIYSTYILCELNDSAIETINKNLLAFKKVLNNLIASVNLFLPELSQLSVIIVNSIYPGGFSVLTKDYPTGIFPITLTKSDSIQLLILLMSVMVGILPLFGAYLFKVLIALSMAIMVGVALTGIIIYSVRK